MGKKNKGITGKLIMLLLIVPLSFGIYYAGNYIVDKDDTETSEKIDGKFEINVDGIKITNNNYRHHLANVGDSLIIEFKDTETNELVNEKIKVSTTADADKALVIKDMFGSEQFAAIKISLKEHTKNAKVSFYNATINLYFTLWIYSNIINAETIELPSITFYE